MDTLLFYKYNISAVPLAWMFNPIETNMEQGQEGYLKSLTWPLTTLTPLRHNQQRRARVNCVSCPHQPLLT